MSVLVLTVPDIPCTQRLLYFLFVLFENIGERGSEASENKSGTRDYFLLPHPYPLALAVNKSPRFLFFITRARRTLKRK